MASSGPSSSSSGPKGNAPKGNDFKNASTLGTWTCKAVEFCRGVLKLSKNSEASQSALTDMPLSDHEQCFATVAGHMDLHGSSGAKVYADQSLIQRSHIFRWRYVDRVSDILSRGTEILGKYDFDACARDLFGISNSTITFNDENATPGGDGGLMSKAYSERKSSWNDRTKPLVVPAKDEAKHEEFLTLLEQVIEKFCVDGDPANFKSHLLMMISANDVTKGKTHVPPHKGEVTEKIVALLKRFRIGTVSIIGPGSETNWG